MLLPRIELGTLSAYEDRYTTEKSSDVTTMGSDRENPGAPNPNGPNGGPQA
jgi:hypothetical protein